MKDMFTNTIIISYLVDAFLPEDLEIWNCIIPNRNICTELTEKSAHGGLCSMLPPPRPEPTTYFDAGYIFHAILTSVVQLFFRHQYT